MRIEERDTVVIGGGAAGMAAAVGLKSKGFDVVLIERDHVLGGILNQCIHNGFGLHHFKEELTGPEYAERYADKVSASGVGVYTSMTIAEIVPDPDQDRHHVYGFSAAEGMVCFATKTIVLAMGCRERNRGNIGTSGTRPSGVYTAGLAQRLVNVEGYIPGQEVVIVGSGDIGLIMARRMSWVGAQVKAVIEIQPYPAGLTRNIVQCLNDFKIPLYLNHVVSEIRGKDRVESVIVSPRDPAKPSFEIPCDTVLLSVGLVPDTEVMRTCGVELNPETGGPKVDSMHMTNVPGIFACGNVLHVHDLVDYVTEESLLCAEAVSEFLMGKRDRKQVRISAGANLKYVVPGKLDLENDNPFYMRSLVVSNSGELSIVADGEPVLVKRLRHVQPSEMIHITLPKAAAERINPEAVVEIHLKELGNG